MIKILSRLFDSFSRRIFDYSTGFFMVTLKFSCTIYYMYLYIVPLNTIHEIRIIQATSEHIYFTCMTGDHRKV
jgi:hypothetical protein